MANVRRTIILPRSPNPAPTGEISFRRRRSLSLSWHPLNDMGNAMRLAQAMQRIPQRHGLLVVAARGKEIAWLPHSQHVAGTLPQLHQHIGIDPCDDWSTEGIEYDFDGDIVRIPARQEVHALDAHELPVEATGIDPRIGDHGADPLGCLGLHHDIPVAISIGDAQDNAPVRPLGDAQSVNAVDRSHSNPPSGSCISPKVAEAGESETPLPGGGQADG